MAIIFWIIVVILALMAFVAYSGANRYPWAYPGAFALTVVALILLGLRVFAGALH